MLYKSFTLWLELPMTSLILCCKSLTKYLGLLLRGFTWTLLVDGPASSRPGYFIIFGPFETGSALFTGNVEITEYSVSNSPTIRCG